MNLIDLVIIILIVVFCIRGYLKGFISELFSLLIIVFGLAGAFLFYRPLGMVFGEFIKNDDLSLIVSFFTILISVSLILIIVRNLLIQFVERLNLTDIDYVLGVMLGLGKGILLCGSLFIFLKNHPFLRIDEMIGKSIIFPFLGRLFIAIISLLPDRTEVFINRILGIV